MGKGEAFTVQAIADIAGPAVSYAAKPQVARESGDYHKLKACLLASIQGSAAARALLSAVLHSLIVRWALMCH